MSFQPNPNDELILNGERYRIAEHPAAPGMPHGQEGRAGTVYHLLPSSGQAEAALKVFKPRFRLPHLVSQAERLAAFASLPGLHAAQRTVLTPSRHAELLRQHPDLTYAVLMPWIEGPTWLEVILDQQPFSPDQSLTLARELAEVLMRMEEQGLAHCDLSGPNLMLPALAGDKGIELIDLEGFYAPGMPQPEVLSSGSAGYAHQQASGGLWGPDADRFAGAVLLAEMLGWCDPAVVEQAWGESYFNPAEMQSDCPRYHLLEASLRRQWGEATADLFRRAWQSEALAECPTFGEWLVALPQSIVGQVGNLPTPTHTEPLPAEPAPSPAESIPLVAEIRAFLQVGRKMEEAGNYQGALTAYQQALELAQGEPSLHSLASEIALMLQEVKTKHAGAPPTAASGEQPTDVTPTLLISKESVQQALATGRSQPPAPEAISYPLAESIAGETTAEPRPQRKRLAWGWVIGLIGLLVLLGFGLQQQAEQRAQATATAQAQATATARAQATATAQAQATAQARATATARVQATATAQAKATATARAQATQSTVVVFVYPVDGQTLGYNGSWLFQVQPIANANGFLWGFFQNGVLVWENLRDEAHYQAMNTRFSLVVKHTANLFQEVLRSGFALG